jgi:hypothetical protein
MHGWLDREIMLISLCAPSSASIQAHRRTPEPTTLAAIARRQDHHDLFYM